MASIINDPTSVAEYILAKMDDQYILTGLNDADRMKVSSLKALMESHERLYRLLRTRPDDGTTAEDGELWSNAVREALEQAEAIRVESSLLHSQTLVEAIKSDPRGL